MFEEFVKNQPLISIILFSFVISLALTLIYKMLTNQKRIKELKEEQKELQIKMKEEKDKEKMLEIQKSMLEKSAELMKSTMKPTLITFIPLLLIFIFLKQTYTAAEVGNIISWSIKVPVLCTVLPGVCDGAGWFLSYVIFSLIFSILLRKIFKIH